MNLRDFFVTNRWWGKLFGCFFGYLIAGSAGAIIGILVGNFFDRGLAAHFSQPHATYYEEQRESVQKIFFEASFSIMGYIAKSDGRVTEKELEMARLIMREMRLNREQKDSAKRFFNSGKLVDFPLDSLLDSLKNACHDNSQLIKLFIDIQYRCAQVDGLSANKIQALDYIFKRLGFAPLKQQYRFYEDEFGRFYKQQKYSYEHSEQGSYTPPPSQLSQAFALLEISESANKQEVKRAYRRLRSRHHPDKLISQGLSEAVIKRANDKTHQITKAYEQICQAKGWPH